MNAYEARRLENIKRNQALIQELGIERHARHISKTESNSKTTQPSKKRKRPDIAPSRVSARIAASGTRPSYNDDAVPAAAPAEPQRRRAKGASKGAPLEADDNEALPQLQRSLIPDTDIETLRASWSSWTPEAPPPSRDDFTKAFHFSDAPDFTPNKSPQEMLHEGCFGGSYFRPLYSRTLGVTVEGDWRELPEEWLEGLEVTKYLTSTTYDPDVNKFKVSCGQSIEEWEAQGWIDHKYDVRGWFQWYCRFFMGRRCDDDERQIGRWKRCVGDRGRWRRMLLKKYVSLGVRECFDDGEDGEDTPEVSPVMHQTCLHWAFEVRQDVLDDFWRTG